MKAVVYTSYGTPEVLKYIEVAKPIPSDDQVLIRVRAASINALDYRRFENLTSVGCFMEERLIKSSNKILGSDISGVIESVGSKVDRLKPGDEVFGFTIENFGGFAQYTCVYQNNVVIKPKNLSFEEAAAVPVAATAAFQAIKKAGGIASGQEVLIHGASGGVGTFALQFAKVSGAKVVAVCSSQNVKIAQSLGADDCIDYTKSDFLGQNRKYDRIIVVNGNRSILDYRKALKSDGICIVIGGTISQIFQSILFGPIMSKMGGKKIQFMGISKPNLLDLEKINKLLEAKKVEPVVEKVFSLMETKEAINYILNGHARGKVIIVVH